MLLPYFNPDAHFYKLNLASNDGYLQSLATKQWNCQIELQQMFWSDNGGSVSHMLYYNGLMASIKEAIS